MIAVTGSTGTIGAELVRLLSAAGEPVRAFHRRNGGEAMPAVPLVTWVRMDLGAVDALAAALAGTTRLFLLTGNDPGFAAIQLGAVRAAERAGVRHIVKLSALGASDHSRSWIARDHWAVEQALRGGRPAWTLLRPHAFMQNWLTDAAETVRTEGVIYAAIGDGRVPFIDTRDIAAVAALVLRDAAAHAEQNYVLTGGVAVGYAEVAAAIGDAIGRSVTYRPISLQDARARLLARGLTPQAVDAYVAIAAYQRDGGPTALVSPTVERLLGRPPRTVREFVRDHVAHFRLPQ
jgi:uncharacterized protein YbjT (DUF2867 family)